jgi:hypothetical protein
MKNNSVILKWTADAVHNFQINSILEISLGFHVAIKGYITLPPTLHLSPHDILKKEIRKIDGLDRLWRRETAANPSWPPHSSSLPMIFWRKKFEKTNHRNLQKKTYKKVALIKTNYEEGRLQPTPAGYPQLATPLFLSPHDILKKEIRKNNRNCLKDT